MPRDPIVGTLFPLFQTVTVPCGVPAVYNQAFSGFPLVFLVSIWFTAFGTS